MKTKLIAALWLLFSFQALATTATITGTITDLSGAAVTSGQVTFLLQPGLDTTISGTARFVPSTVTCGINGSGLVKNLALSAACTVTTNTSLTPSGTWYQVCMWPANVKTGCFNTYITGSVDITTATPTPTTSPIYSLVDTLSAQTIAGNKTFTGDTTLSGTLTAGTSTVGVTTVTSVGIGSGTVITKSIGTSFTYDFPNILANTCVDSSAQTLTGAVDGDAVYVGALAAALSAIQINITAYVNVADQVKVRACNPTVGAINPASTTFRVVDLRF